MASSYYGLVLLISVAIGSVSSLALDEFDMFKLKFGKVYQSADEESSHRAIFMRNKEYIDSHNANPAHSYQLKINQFSDINPIEFFKARNRHTGFASKNKKGNLIYKPNITMNDLPTSVDWRDKNVVTAVKDQGQCGSCWAFSTTGSLESQHALKTNRLVSLSEQQLIDCSLQNYGCEGGIQELAFEYIKENGGIDTEQSYPYEASDETSCLYSKAYIGATCSSYVSVDAYNCDDLKKAVSTVGPISVSMDANHESFMSYSSGIYNPTTCNSNRMHLDHAVLVVGYGSDNGTDYWLVKNSWGTTWGLDGYFKIVSADNTCGICTDAVYPVV